MKYIAAGLLPFSIVQAANDPVAIIGGQGNAPYAAFIENNGNVKTLEVLPDTGLTFRVSMNSGREGLIGGTDGVDAYAAFAAPDGKLTSMPGLLAPGEIYFVSINKSSLGLIGGGHASSNFPYAAYVDKDMTVTPIAGLPGTGLIYGVSLDNDGTGLIGGIGPSNSAYAAFTAPDGTLTPLTGLPVNGAIFWVSNNRFIGGKDSTNAYAAFVSSEGVVTPVAGLPAGQLYSVAINPFDQAIVGGTSASLPYAALVAADGAITTLPGLPTTNGIIYNVAINRSGTGLIGGFSATGAYSAFVSPEGTLRPLLDLPTGVNSFVDGLALHDSGAAIIGGTTSANVPFAALVAPNGTLTYLSGLPDEGQINSIALASLDSLVPDAVGPFDSWANTLFMFSNALTQHNLFQRGCDCSCGFWVAPFWNSVREDSCKTVPDFTDTISGALLGFDWNITPNFMIGAAVAYGYNHVHLFKHLGHHNLRQESGALYAYLDTDFICVDISVWGGRYQTENTRRSLGLLTSECKQHGWTLNPHLEISKGFNKCPNFEPYVMFDYANLWQDRYHEHGRSGFNLSFKERHDALLRSEAGIRIYQTLNYCWGSMLFEEKGGFVNRTIMTDGKADAAFDEAFSTFEVVTLSRRGQNHGVVEFHVECLPKSFSGAYAALDYQAEFGSWFHAHAVVMTLGYDF